MRNFSPTAQACAAPKPPKKGHDANPPIRLGPHAAMTLVLVAQADSLSPEEWVMKAIARRADEIGWRQLADQVEILGYDRGCDVTPAEMRGEESGEPSGGGQHGHAARRTGTPGEPEDGLDATCRPSFRFPLSVRFPRGGQS